MSENEKSDTKLTPLDGQNYLGIQFLLDDGKRKYDKEKDELVEVERKLSVVAVRVLFVTDTMEEANILAQKYHDMDDRYHIFIGDMCDFLAFNPHIYDKNFVKSVKYDPRDEGLDDLMKADDENKSKAEIFKEKRIVSDKKAVIEKNIANKKKEEKSVKKVRSKLKKENKKADLTSYDDQLKAIDENIKKYEKEYDELAEKESEIMDKLQEYNENMKPNTKLVGEYKDNDAQHEN